MRKRSVVLFILILALLLPGCSGSLFEKNNGKLKVLASFYPMYDFASKIGGDQAEVKMLIPSGAEPHSWEPSTRDMLAFEEADVFVYSGAGMEQWVDKILASIQNKNLVTVEASSGITLMETGLRSIESDHTEDTTEDEHDSEEEEHEDQTLYDPHVWLDPQNAKFQMKAICDAFCLKDPDNAEYYQSNYSRYAGELDLLDAEFETALSSFTDKNIVVAHEAFGYLCQAYDLYQIPIKGISADAEPDAARMREIVDFADRYDVKVIFFEELTSPEVAEAIASETGCETRALNPLGGLTQEQIDAGEEYFSVMRSNLEALTYALS
jgi:zinc transport system substrate-binding protein